MLLLLPPSTWPVRNEGEKLGEQSKTSQGHIYIEGVDTAIVNILGSGVAELVYNNVYLTSNLFSKEAYGSFVVKVLESSEYELSTKTTNGHSRVNLKQIEQYNGISEKENPLIAVNCDYSDNKINIETLNGNVTVLDSLFF